MGLKARRANIPHGRYSRALVLPAAIKKGEVSTLAADRLILVDPRGEIGEEDLLSFLEDVIEPRLWSWLQSLKNKAPTHGMSADERRGGTSRGSGIQDQA